MPASVCDAPCATDGLCEVSTEHAGDSSYRCYAGSDEQCRASSACRSAGNCFASEDGACVPEAALESHRCVHAASCRLHGGCHPRDGFCEAASDADCRASLECLTQGRCAYDDGLCLVGDSDCGATTGCALEGTCTTQHLPLAILGIGPICGLTESGSCANTEACRREGRCAVRPVEGCTDHCHLFYCARPEDSVGVAPCTEEPGGALLVCAPDGRCMRDAGGECRHLDLLSSSMPSPTPTLPTPSMPLPTLPPSPQLSLPPRGAASTSAHPHAIVSFALSPDGTQLATGSGCGEGEDFESETVGIVLWDIRSGSPERLVPVEGGIGLDNPLRRGLRYSSEGHSLGFDYFTNQVGVLDPSTGDLRVEAAASVEDHAPSFALEAGSGRLYVHASAACSRPSMGSLYSARSGALEDCIPGSRSGAAEVLAFRAGVIHLVDQGVLYAVNTRGSELHRTPLFAEGGRVEVWPSPTGRRVAATLEGGGLTVLEVDDHRRPFSDSAISATSGVIFDPVERRFAAIGTGRSAAGPEGITVFTEDATLGTLPGPLVERDWLGFADGIPAAFSPEGRHMVVLRPDGTLERWDLDPHPHLAATLAPIEGARAVLWPTTEILIALGPQRLTFLRADGTVIADHRFPR